jgi:hypothetical protein
MTVIFVDTFVRTSNVTIHPKFVRAYSYRQEIAQYLYYENQSTNNILGM